MTEWYSPKEKLPVEDETVIGIKYSRGFCYACLRFKHKECCWKNDLNNRVLDPPDFWCYFPAPPKALINKLNDNIK